MLYKDSFIETPPPSKEQQDITKRREDKQNLWFFGTTEPTYNDYAQLCCNCMEPSFRYIVGDYGKNRPCGFDDMGMPIYNG